MPPKKKGSSSSQTNSGAGSGSKKPTCHGASKSSGFICPICDDDIIDETQQSVMCDGPCASWLHRGCAGLSRVAFSKLEGSDNPFLCTRCCLEAQSIEIISLKESLAALSSQLNSLQQTLSSRSQPIEALSTEIIQIKNRLEEAPSFPPSIHISHSSPTSGVAPQTNVPGTVGKKAIPSVTDRKYNIVVFGITDEPSQGTPRVTRINSDIERVTEELTQLATTSGFSFQVRDCHHLGQYRPNSTKSRPLLVTLSSTIQVSNILSNCHHLSGVVSVRPDLSASERRERGILMKERWKLVNADIDRRPIKVKGSGLYVSGNLTGKVLNGVFQVTQGLGAKAPQLYSILNNQNQSISVNSNSTSDQSDIIP
ncbi:PREDICTED: uncharacterized protein LOC100634511 [Amphimedon queenslandica]|uniref:PHD-type domain-containing protein n=1 Tax=Amphimedon queenslandica TaxID=400682 RepID=A0AAN0IVZ7_AMPQE|nr:PREDICTED: uncharacterized protein LOC100634511 [Amphimedon queenslandica]|eukprot:XP_019848641.1 PREDICTED: uncharacterized protein LOC100634511 [Amphimedon queenslandica]